MNLLVPDESLALRSFSNRRPPLLHLRLSLQRRLRPVQLPRNFSFVITIPIIKTIGVAKMLWAKLCQR